MRCHKCIEGSTARRIYAADGTDGGTLLMFATTSKEEVMLAASDDDTDDITVSRV